MGSCKAIYQLCAWHHASSPRQALPRPQHKPFFPCKQEEEEEEEPEEDTDNAFDSYFDPIADLEAANAAAGGADADVDDVAEADDDMDDDDVAEAQQTEEEALGAAIPEWEGQGAAADAAGPSEPMRTYPNGRSYPERCAAPTSPASMHGHCNEGMHPRIMALFMLSLSLFW